VLIECKIYLVSMFPIEIVKSLAIMKCFASTYTKSKTGCEDMLNATAAELAASIVLLLMIFC
jgi:hypothetical protein